MKRLTLAIGLVVATSCQPAERSRQVEFVDPVPRIPRPVRKVTPVSWDTVFTVGGGALDTLLLLPRTLGGSGDRIAAFDYGDNRIKRFDLAGTLVWTSGRKGSGPGEFEGNFGIQIDSAGLVWAADPNLSRLTALDDTGGVVVAIPVPMDDIAGMAVVRGQPIVVSTGQSRFLIRLGLDGSASETQAPPEMFRSLPNFARSVIVASSGGPVWALAFPYGNVFQVYEGMVPRCTGKLVTGTGFPTGPMREAVISVSAIGLRGQTVVLLANGGGEGRLRHLDSFSLTDCRYLESWELPRRYSAMAIANEVFVLEYHDPAPRLVGLRIKE